MDISRTTPDNTHIDQKR